MRAVTATALELSGERRSDQVRHAAEKMDRDIRHRPQSQIDQLRRQESPVEPLVNPLIQFGGHGGNAALRQSIE
jgi:hypothetical protein